MADPIFVLDPDSDYAGEALGNFVEETWREARKEDGADLADPEEWAIVYYQTLASLGKMPALALSEIQRRLEASPEWLPYHPEGFNTIRGMLASACGDSMSEGEISDNAFMAEEGLEFLRQHEMDLPVRLFTRDGTRLSGKGRAAKAALRSILRSDIPDQEKVVKARELMEKVADPEVPERTIRKLRADNRVIDGFMVRVFVEGEGTLYVIQTTSEAQDRFLETRLRGVGEFHHSDIPLKKWAKNRMV